MPTTHSWLLTLILFSLTACAGPVSPTSEPGKPTRPASSGFEPSSTPLSSATPVPDPSFTPQTASFTQTPRAPTATATTPPAQGVSICSPLAAVPLEGLPEAVANPYAPPVIGSDDPHQGVDLAERVGDPPIAVPGMPVLAALAGQVAAVIRDRFPYGNAILVETLLEPLPQDWVQALALPEPLNETLTHPALTCPVEPHGLPQAQERRSVYLLYAHLEMDPALDPGDPVDCGQVLGAVGATGNALNPHLHLEARVGPAGAQFPGLAHYEPRATPAEMAAYCSWRVNGLFQPLDPLLVLGVGE